MTFYRQWWVVVVVGGGGRCRETVVRYISVQYSTNSATDAERVHHTDRRRHIGQTWGHRGGGALEHVATFNHLNNLHLPAPAAAPSTPSLPHTLLWAARAAPIHPGHGRGKGWGGGEVGDGWR